MDWKEATRAQLCEIAFNDIGARLEHRLAAQEELMRRSQSLPKLQHQVKIRRKRA